MLPTSLLGKAISYTVGLWSRLIKFVDHEEVEIDNNLIDHKIRPLALGRKNYLFAGSHESAQRAAMLYSFLASCKLNNINPFNWLSEILNRIAYHPTNQIDDLLPQKWTPFNGGALMDRYIVREIFPEFDVEDFINLPNYHIYLKLMIDGRPSRGFSGRVLKFNNL